MLRASCSRVRRRMEISTPVASAARAPRLLAMIAFAAGLIGIVSAATPEWHGRLSLVREYLSTVDAQRRGRSRRRQLARAARARARSRAPPPSRLAGRRDRARRERAPASREGSRLRGGDLRPRRAHAARAPSTCVRRGRRSRRARCAQAWRRWRRSRACSPTGSWRSRSTTRCAATGSRPPPRCARCCSAWSGRT